MFSVGKMATCLVWILFMAMMVPFAEGYFFSSWYRRVISFQENHECQRNSSTTYAIIVHGWKGSCRENWVQDLKTNLEIYRGGCIICMDYEIAASIPHYLMLTHHANILSNILKEKLDELEFRGYHPRNGYVFGFSLGARIAIRAGTMFGYQRLGEIDACDMAGPGFDWFDRFKPTAAAKNVQCIHTSKSKGTLSRNCHQNWNMGVCGMYQVGSAILPGTGTLTSHGLCHRFYNAAFTNNFYAEHVPEQCDLVSTVPQTWPHNYKMGYMERRKSQVRGVLYASTMSEYPYTTNTNQIVAYQVHNLDRQFTMVIQDPKHFLIYLKR
ncbi:pancreatic lipase-related protein 2 [Eupeodes corollae]|uniref:pancreatic lipase-related protein 2 n=1 Tax=Eupeodes corollae TaxID=290404 RepID=UPI002491C23D|nr:pancreatic lipase-related protein 2 [Eupeodes corollae]